MNNDYNFIHKLKKDNQVSKIDTERLWKVYAKYFGKYPNGKMTCSSCVSQSVDDLLKYLILQLIFE